MAWRLYALELSRLEGTAGEVLSGAVWEEGYPARFEPLEAPWEARRAPPVPWPEPLYFVDGRERAEAVLSDGRRLALLGCVAAGALVYRQGNMGLLETRVRRVGVGLEEALRLGGLVYEPLPLEGGPGPGDPLPALQEGLRKARALLEEEVAGGLTGGLLIVDGPVRLRRRDPVLGYIKTHWARYLPEGKEALLFALKPGERTPMFRVHRGGQALASWYLRLPLPPEGVRPPESGLLRVETPLQEGASALADLSLSLFPALASHPVKDPRAPQNLLPVGGLERELARRMGSREVVGRLLARHLGGG
ncbi:DNA double-strand break repair nuclease NurA [Thermus amyloliquefaciens]|uniref:DNA double-strand break repair nuclease NurA n=1 Tax=Thermus amyloliquefaciens TaxID=1449080 RepID=UPI000571AA34|nr:DNA double-strand break repair nuclease NurA [Thermus amyloliquefaciens]